MVWLQRANLQEANLTETNLNPNSMIEIVFLLLVTISIIGIHIAILRWLLRINERLDEAKKTNYLLEQLLKKFNRIKSNNPNTMPGFT